MLLCTQIFKQLFFKEGSAAEMGTSCASMNRTGKSNAKRGPEKDYNAFKDFIDRETEAHIITKWMLFSGMTDMEGILQSSFNNAFKQLVLDKS